MVLDDTNSYILLLYHFFNEKLSSQVLIMESFICNRKCVNVRVCKCGNKREYKINCKKTRTYYSKQLGSTCITEWVNVGAWFGVKETKVLKVLKSKPCTYNLLGKKNVSMSGMINQDSKFTLKFYGQPSYDSMINDYNQIGSMKSQSWQWRNNTSACLF